MTFGCNVFAWFCFARWLWKMVVDGVWVGE